MYIRHGSRGSDGPALRKEHLTNVRDGSEGIPGGRSAEKAKLGPDGFTRPPTLITLVANHLYQYGGGHRARGAMLVRFDDGRGWPMA
jgi:hypothetical protein